MSRELYEIAIKDWVTDTLGSILNDIMFSNPRTASGKPRPAGLKATKPYASILVLSSGRLGGEDDRVSEYDEGADELKTTIISRYQGTVSITVFGQLAARNIRSLERSLEYDDVRDANRARGLVVAYAITETIRLSRDSASVVGDRAVADFVFRFAESETRSSPAYIDTIETTPNITSA